MPASVAELSDRTFTRSSMGFTGLILQCEHQTVACCSDISQLLYIAAQFGAEPGISRDAQAGEEAG